MRSERIRATLPVDVAHQLIETGIAVQVPATRTGLPLADITVTGLSVLTTVITLAQAPSAIEDIARRLTAWRRRAQLSRDPVVSVDASGPNGRVSLRLTGRTSEDEVAHAISLVLSRPDVVDRVPEAPPPQLGE